MVELPVWEDESENWPDELVPVSKVGQLEDSRTGVPCVCVAHTFFQLPIVVHASPPPLAPEDDEDEDETEENAA